MVFKLEDIDKAAEWVLEVAGDKRVIAFYGGMGAGKTTLIKAICKKLGVEDTVTSPTFAIVNEYAGGNGDPVYHFDFYRIKKLEEVRDISFDEYAYSGYFCFLEWPELIEDLLPEDTIKISISETDENEYRGVLLITF
ncbi:MAG: tRNA (adenosine(37)-N6)-threonylcarbamoyltransferase complex ATPase subunit type 1 TsaE [Bacteroidaceae bacterium]|nr:tRNA (adenosine(37)-N6)-threonylcarbamoyltransferase complex ATPase subunit type 1 TsaE [Bacteroidaceae bacterium]